MSIFNHILSGRNYAKFQLLYTYKINLWRGCHQGFTRSNESLLNENVVERARIEFKENKY